MSKVLSHKVVKNNPKEVEGVDPYDSSEGDYEGDSKNVDEPNYQTQAHMRLLEIEKLEATKERLEDVLLEEYIYHQLRSQALKRQLNDLGIQVPGQVD